MKKITSIAIVAIALIMFSCQKDQALQTEATQDVNIAAVKQQIRETYETLKNVQGIDLTSNLETRDGQFIVIPANSNNALVKAFADAGEGGIVYLRAGNHTETSAITISKRVILIGEDGAVLKVKSIARPANANGSIPTEIGLRVLNAPRTLIQNIDIQPIDPIGGAAVFVENSNESAVMGCTVNKHEVGIAIEKSDRTTVMRNKVTISDAWQTGGIPVAIGIVNMNGLSTYIADNSVSSAIMGIFVCDKYGTCERNTATGNLIGIILCKVPKALITPEGNITGADVSCELWKVRNNVSTDNINDGYLVIDGANNNLMENNQAARNGAYDIELTSDTDRFGFLAPFAFNNTVRASAGQKVKDCGRNNSVTGGTIVNNAIDPCK